MRSKSLFYNKIFFDSLLVLMINGELRKCMNSIIVSDGKFI